MNRFGLGERGAPQPLIDHDDRRPAMLTLAYLHYWDKGMRVPADIAARLIEEGYDVEALSIRWVSSGRCHTHFMNEPLFILVRYPTRLVVIFQG